MYDAAAVRFFDLAHEGAFIRGARRLIDDGICSDITELQPRSLIVLVADELSRAAAQLACALVEPLPLPVTIVDSLPRYAGPLDVVVVASSKSVAPQERDLHEAARRGCVSILLAPSEGPLRDEAPEGAYVVPVPATTEGVAPSAVVATVYALAVSLTTPARVVGEHLDLAAAAVDEELLSVSPERDELVNQARQLHTLAVENRVVHSGLSGAPAELARVISTGWAANGLVSAALELSELQAALPNLNVNETDIFHDPFEEGEQLVLPLRTVVWAQRDSAVPRSVAQHAESDEISLENILRLMVRGLAAAVY